jgi:aldehyde:ferredoxin oxidoreductase
MSVEELVELVAGVTGWETSAWELMRLGERRFHLLRVYNLREKFTALDDTLPARFFTQAVDAGRLAGSRLDRDVFEDVKRSYYRMMGWTDDGVPRFETLVDHRIEWAAADAGQE